ncbi:MAG: hypothetical protein GY757_50200 [bacterium]|nr:hypothetical protein [bacterium]
MKLSKFGYIFGKPLMLLIPLLILFAACDSKPEVRNYTETVTNEKSEPAKTPPAAHHGVKPPTHTARPHYQWDCPKGWTEKSGGSGFRLATFTIKTETHESMCSVIPLQGEAGGLTANVIRWLGQVGIQVDDKSAELKQVLDKQEKFLTAGNYPCVLVDLTLVTKGDETPSTLAAVATVEGNSVFFKMNGPRAHLLENKENFKALCLSFASKTDSK